MTDSGLTFPQGFTAAAMAAGIKPSGKTDLSCVVSDAACAWAFVGTRSSAAAACVTRNREVYGQAGPVRALVVNAGNANAATGAQGARDNADIADALGSVLNVEPDAVLTASTGIIGHLLPMDRVLSGVEHLPDELGRDAAPFAAAIMTTDTHPKTAQATLSTGARIVGTAKGSGMIHPDMATMFAFAFSDARVDQAALRAAFPAIVNRTFNAVTVDGDTSTNDMALVLANGHAGDVDPAEFLTALEGVMRDLARQIAADGEGATKLLTVRVSGARSEAEALTAARTCCVSPLLKSAVHGNDPNWGRVIMAVGRSGAAVDVERMTVQVQGTPVFAGRPLPYDAAQVSASMQAPEVVFEVGLGVGDAAGEAWGCDLSAEYVSINADYTT
ncbi:bifunctional glutamate N-acetyltransferase/amino-acid acetyltransferase ArgJ [Deinococcus metallilatus]|uniref:Arginine biosynthesis bifunctional protein ArgJ n=1 Tax=Deinococcus metallilatus TaxID=1211322 RepID=A0AAJ5F076_9DEIO|nr:bifunctional glutamate N-acetyltransferase/amino-acid acetyltransferase ArgJ [Deinococcus metallilatus]MBB5295319.1 glutamate N-acetyltransferase/amino-acid N-acetyltransferase [Deinococcus metallilatus]QBY08527.1 bifunctional glutamate N-acetyltransferase/amino-acid acetyltransferase ArgJ [Deinococcus metallilatus]RXJ11037.1 bifunctional glutamate N-acetyltransferase/amino-acid acetyltransferase ArgJ [Deinococcus metallilatus]TLK21585.1 bifunctional glutamate N-acetyltransferase/amino-acid 